jgi:hypothetical protein
MKTKSFKKISGVFFVIIIITGIFSCTNQKKQDEVTQKIVNEFEKPKGTGVSIDSLNRSGVDIVLWAETKESYQNLIKDTLIQVSQSPYGFYYPPTDMSCFDWPAVKHYMMLCYESSLSEILNNNNGEKFVIIGNYSTTDQHLFRFTGYLYTYKH